MTVLDLRVATLNVAGGGKTFEQISHDTQQSRLEALERLIQHLNADLLCLQEVSQFIDPDGTSHSLMDNVNKSGDFDHNYYGKTISMKTHMQVKNEVMVDGVFNDWLDWTKGNAVHSKIPFSRLSDPEVPGEPRNIPLCQPVVYEGNRDTDPRHVILTRLNAAPFPYAATLHLTTLVGERNPKASQTSIKRSQDLRNRQIGQFINLVRKHILLDRQPMILTGDFNAEKDEACIQQLLEVGFVHLEPQNEGPSHAGSGKMIDHILFFPQERLANFECNIEDTDLSRRASDHLPIVADMCIKLD